MEQIPCDNQIRNLLDPIAPFLYEWLAFLAANHDIDELSVHRWNGRFTKITRYRYVDDLPSPGGDDALTLHWLEITVTNGKTGEILYHNALVTNHLLTEPLASFLLTLNLLAFLFHTVLELADAKYHLLRQERAARQTFFNDVRILTRYFCFDSWQHLLDFMITRLEPQPMLNTS